MKNKIKKHVKQHLDLYMDLVKEMYAHPEIGNEEFKTMALLCDALKNLGFDTTSAYVCPTGFQGIYRSQKNGPVFAFLCEYDALPEV